MLCTSLESTGYPVEKQRATYIERLGGSAAHSDIRFSVVAGVDMLTSGVGARHGVSLHTSEFWSGLRGAGAPAGRQGEVVPLRCLSSISSALGGAKVSGNRSASLLDASRSDASFCSRACRHSATRCSSSRSSSAVREKRARLVAGSPSRSMCPGRQSASSASLAALFMLCRVWVVRGGGALGSVRALKTNTGLRAGGLDTMGPARVPAWRAEPGGRRRGRVWAWCHLR